MARSRARSVLMKARESGILAGRPEQRADDPEPMHGRRFLLPHPVQQPRYLYPLQGPCSLMVAARIIKPLAMPDRASGVTGGGKRPSGASVHLDDL